MEKKEKKVYKANVIHSEQYIAKNDTIKYSYIVVIANWNATKKSFDGYKLIKVSSATKHNFGEEILFQCHKNMATGEYFYSEIENKEVPF